MNILILGKKNSSIVTAINNHPIYNCINKTISDDTPMADIDVIFILDFKFFNNKFVQSNLNKCLIDADCFSNTEFKLLDTYKKIYYLNCFEAIIGENKYKQASIYPKIYDLNQVLDDSFINDFKNNKGFRVNETLLLTNKPNKHFILYNVPLFSRYNNLIFKKYSGLSLMSNSTLINYINKNSISRVILNLPYRHFLKRRLLKKLKFSKIPYLILERGALPQALIFDDTEFNYNSPYYKPEYWDKEYTKEEVNYKDSFIDKIIEGASLEGQASTSDSLKVTQSIKEKANGRKIIFVPLQRPRDSVIRYFNKRGYFDFVNEIINFSENYGKDYYVIIKKHPLEKKWPGSLNKSNYKNIFLVDNSAHVNNLINISEAVALINSGVGVVAMTLNKYVYYFGECFYPVADCNDSFVSAKDLFNKISKQPPVNLKNSNKFLCYLYNYYYSIVELIPIKEFDILIHKYSKLTIPKLKKNNLK